MSFIKNFSCLFLLSRITPPQTSSTDLLRFVIEFRIIMLRSFVVCVCFVDHCLPFCHFSCGHCVVCHSIYGFWLPLWYLQTLRMWICEWVPYVWSIDFLLFDVVTQQIWSSSTMWKNIMQKWGRNKTNRATTFCLLEKCI